MDERFLDLINLQLFAGEMALTTPQEFQKMPEIARLYYDVKDEMSRCAYLFIFFQIWSLAMDLNFKNDNDKNELAYILNNKKKVTLTENTIAQAIGISTHLLMDALNPLIKAELIKREGFTYFIPDSFGYKQ